MHVRLFRRIVLRRRWFFKASYALVLDVMYISRTKINDETILVDGEGGAEW